MFAGCLTGHLRLQGGREKEQDDLGKQNSGNRNNCTLSSWPANAVVLRGLKGSRLAFVSGELVTPPAKWSIKLLSPFSSSVNSRDAQSTSAPSPAEGAPGLYVLERHSPKPLQRGHLAC